MENVNTTQENIKEEPVESAVTEETTEKCACACDACEKVKYFNSEVQRYVEKIKELEEQLEEQKAVMEKHNATMQKKKKLGVDYIWTDKKRTFLGLPWSFTRYILTETKFITRVGFFTLREDEVDLYRIFDKSFEQTFGQRLVGVGTVVITSGDKDTPIKEVKSIKRPREFMAILEKYVDIQRTKYSVRGRDMIGTGQLLDCDCDCDTEHIY